MLVAGRPVALFRCSPDDRLYAVGNTDPFCDASVIARGIVGSTRSGDDELVFVASPLRKHRFSLETGASLDHANIGLGVWAVRTCAGRVEVRAVPSVAPKRR
jgi:nitrite reductase/ring-hydroxylating ferredoxin subunit